MSNYLHKTDVRIGVKILKCFMRFMKYCKFKFQLKIIVMSNVFQPTTTCII